MKSPLEYDQKVKKEFGIDDSLEMDFDQTLGFVRAQYDEIKKFLLRERVELILSEAQADSDIEALAAEAKNKVASHRQTIKGIVSSLRVLGNFITDLETTQTHE